MADDQVLTDTSDMIAIHDTIRRAIRDAPGQIKAVSDGDIERARRVAEYLSEVFWLLQVHHEGEDELLYPLLEERLPQHKELFARMEAHQTRGFDDARQRLVRKQKLLLGRRSFGFRVRVQ